MTSDSEATFKAVEFMEITRMLEALYAAVRAGRGGDYTRQRIERLEAVQAALCGFPDAMSG